MSASRSQQEANQRPSKDEVVARLQTKSDKIRELAKAGYSRSEIADYLGIRYQFVRNVLVNDERVASRAQPDRGRQVQANSDAVTPPHDGKPYPAKVRIEPNGRVEVPPAFLRALGLKENDPVILSLDDDDDAIRLMSLPASVRRAQAIVRRFVPEGVSLVDELLAERRLESEREHGDG
jgi:bifunctional DNA-binding transcriptional regulator/antitoxin component of YhaV-PrlF toxin-antitoxin module